MVCHICGGETAVINSRPQVRSNSVWRRRRCILCDTVVSTSETIDYTKSIVVRPRTTKQLEPFSRDRLFLSLHKSLGHRNSALTDAAGLCTTITTKSITRAHNGVLDADTIMQVTVVALSRFDSLAAQHYQAMHKI